MTAKEWLINNGYQYKGKCRCTVNRYSIWRKRYEEVRIYGNGKFKMVMFGITEIPETPIDELPTAMSSYAAKN